MKLECPKCKSPVAREGQRFCYRCGQELVDFYNSLAPQAQGAPPAAPDAAEAAPPAARPTAERPTPKATGEMPPGPETVAMEALDITLDPDAVAADLLEPKATLRILLPSGDAFDRDITRVETQMGKGARNDLVVSDPAVSSTHALIRFEGGAYTVADVGSRNGTFVNGERLTGPRRLNHGDVIGVGLSKLTFRLAGAETTESIAVADLGGPAKTAAPPPLTEDALAQAVIAAKLAAPAAVERLRGPGAGGRRLYRALVDERLVAEEALRDLMGRAFQIPTVDLRAARVDEALAARFSPQLARERHVFPVAVEGGQLTLAVADPTDTAAVEDARRAADLPVRTRLATAAEIAEQIERHYGAKLIGVLPSGEKVEYPLNKVEIEIGKAAHNYIQLSDATVSSTHAVILARDGYSIVDMGSRNGTFVNNERLGTQAVTLKPGDVIQLGQTVLTFRNPSQTTANVTAVLSADALAAVRKRAEALGVLTPPAGERVITAPTKVEPAPPVAPPVSAPEGAPPAAPDSNGGAAEAEAEEKKKKKKKKKEKEGERLKAAYIGAVSRIIAQVMAVMLSVGLALYIAQRSLSPSAPGTPPGDPGVRMTDQSRFAVPANLTPGVITAPGRIEPSGVAQVRNTGEVLLVSNESKNRLYRMPINAEGKPAGDAQPVAFPPGIQVDDLEAITAATDYYYAIGSQANDKAGGENALARFEYDAAAREIRNLQVIPDFRAWLFDRVLNGDPALKAAAERPETSGGLNIEGLAWDAINSRLLLGLRAPLLGGKAVVVAVKVRQAPEFTPEHLSPDAPAVETLDLGGQGIRDIVFDAKLNAFVIIAGPSDAAPGAKDFRLWVWKPAEARLYQAADLPGLSDDKPEGATPVTLDGRQFLFLVTDQGKRTYAFDYKP